METRELTCIGCPMGCPVKVEMEDGTVVSVTGNTCPKGEAYARKEVVNPTRIVTTTVPVIGGTQPRVSVKTREDIPKERIAACVWALKEIKAAAPIHIGDVILADVEGTDIVATKDVERLSKFEK